MIKKLKKKMKSFNFKDMIIKINFVLLLCIVILLVSSNVRNKQEIVAAVADYPSDELLYYDVYVAGELATHEQITSMIVSGDDWRESDGKPLSIDFRRVKREGICDDLVQEALNSCD